MENKNIIIILVVIILVLSAIVGLLFFQANAKEQSRIEITSNNTLSKGDSLSVLLTDLNNTPISNGEVNVIITDGEGKVVVNETVKTNSNGNANLELNLNKGNYAVNVTFDGNKNYTEDSTTQNLTVKEVDITKSYPEYSPDFGYYRHTGIGQDEMGVLELASGRYIVVAGDGYYEYKGLDSQGNIITGSFLGHGGQIIS